MIWPFIILAYSSLFVFGITDNVRGPLFSDILQSFQINDSMGAWMFALGNISGFASSFVSRFLLARMNRLIVLRIGAVSLTLSLWGLALAPHFYVFLFFSFFMGLSLGILGMLPNVLVPLGTHQDRRQQFISGLHSMYGIASLLAPLIASSITSITHNWRGTFAFVSIAPIFLFLYSYHKTHQGLHQSNNENKQKSAFIINKEFFSQIHLAMMLSCCVGAEIMISSRLALFVQRTLNQDMQTASFYVSSFFICMLAGRLLFTLIKLPISLQAQLSLSQLASALFLIAGLYFNPYFLVLIGFTIAPFYPLSISLISTKFPDKLDKTFSYTMATDSITLVAMHLIIGALTDRFGIKLAMNCGFVFLGASFLLLHSFKWLYEKPNTKPSVSI